MTHHLANPRPPVLLLASVLTAVRIGVALISVTCASTPRSDAAEARRAYAVEPIAARSIQAVTFTNINAALTTAYTTAVSWADYDGDRDLDCVVAGFADDVPFITRLYRNAAGTFMDAAAALPDAGYPSVAWGDYDNDGDLDLAIGGYDRFLGDGRVRIFTNTSGVFADAAAGLPNVSNCSLAWGDYDNDGDLDLLVTGVLSDGSSLSRVYRNDGGGTFVDAVLGLMGVYESAVACGDYDNDGDLDVLLTGNAGDGTNPTPTATVYRNDGASGFTAISAGLQGVWHSAAAWGDYDGDGDLDIAVAGNAGTDISPVFVARVYRNDGGGVFVNVNAALPGVQAGALAWGDYDNDGDLDLLIDGYTGSGGVCRVYRNDGSGVFTDSAAGLPGMWYSSGEWGDYDNDGDLDLLLVGSTTGDPAGDIARIYRSSGAPTNTPPTAPGGLAAQLVGDQLTMSWSAATDGQTPAAGLSYNLRVGTTAGGSEVVSPMASATDGFRRVVRLGNAQKRTSWTMTVPAAPLFYWSVQAIDGAYAGSPFSASTVGVDENSVERLAFTVAGTNPTTGPVQFRFRLPEAAQVKLAIFDVAGRRVEMLLDDALPAGAHSARWFPCDGRIERHSGLYFARLNVGGRTLCRRVALLR